jgi:hypothetical protein
MLIYHVPACANYLNTFYSVSRLSNGHYRNRRRSIRRASSREQDEWQYDKTTPVRYHSAHVICPCAACRHTCSCVNYTAWLRRRRILQMVSTVAIAS